MGIMTNVGKALDKAKEEAQFFSSSKATIIVVLVAWKSNDELGIPAFELKNSSVNIIALGLGLNYLVADLYLLASNSKPDYILTVQFGDLKTFVTVTRDKIYQVANPCSSANCNPGERCVSLYGVNAGYNCIPPASVCYPNLCKNGGNCTITGYSSYNCSCPRGIGGENCTADIFNDCLSEPCQNGGSCENLLGDYRCNCTSGFTGRQCDIVCSFQKFNLVFLVDGSGSIEGQGSGNFQRAKDFVKSIIEEFDISRDGTNIAFVLFASSVQVVFSLNEFYNKADMQQAVQAVPYPAGGTKTGAGLDVVRSQILANLGDRSNLTNIVIVVTDGHSGDDVRAPSSRLRDMNVTIISVGVGCCYDIFNLKDMASDPDDDYVFEATFTTLDTIVGRMRQRICSVVDHCSHKPCANGGTCTSEPSDFICNCTAPWTGKDCWTGEIAHAISSHVTPNQLNTVILFTRFTRKY
ncbi:unnamed protein product [Porites evermanni]|uniref:Uncharacterized protein n=1 Tax=Porites evermanni TaxID=104178 RepID=A0ABN8T0S8_9CNID|nr:unnamed protein product [Porites evermanni]